MWLWTGKSEPQPYKGGWESEEPKFLPPIRLTRRGRIVAFYLAPVVTGVIIYVTLLRDWHWT